MEIEKPKNFDLIDKFFWWMNERERIRLKKEAGEPWPWTTDSLLQRFRFTNVNREDDKTTRWMRKYFTGPNHKNETRKSIVLLNCAVFRFFGNSNFFRKCEASSLPGLTWFNENNPWDSDKVIETARDFYSKNERVFTGAYIIPNFGIKIPKEVVICKEVLEPIWNRLNELDYLLYAADTLSQVFFELNNGNFRGLGSSKGFMAYEIVCDLNHTWVLENATDVCSWANAGPGAIRGLNRLWRRPFKARRTRGQSLEEMRYLYDLGKTQLIPEILERYDLRCVEHSLCEMDKYLRILNNEGRVRAKYKPPVESSGLFKRL